MKKVMIVDDDKEFLNEISYTLKSSGYETIEIAESTLAVKEAAQSMPDLILLDLKMDKKSGFKVADELMVNPKTKNIPVIAITGVFTHQEHKLLMKICNIRECLIKPIDPSAVIDRVEKISSK
jgi:DNA-binding response OmpR family regulator